MSCNFSCLNIIFDCWIGQPWVCFNDFLFYKPIGDSPSQQPNQYDEIQLTHPDDHSTDSNSSSDNQTLATTLQTSFTPSSQQVHKYRIRGITAESNVWRITLKMQLASILIGSFEYCIERNPCLQSKWHTFNLAT